MNQLFDNLFIFEMANSHQGSIEHGIDIIKAMAKIVRKYNIKAAVKLQYRDMDTFIHPDFKDRTDVNHIPRFMSTKLNFDQFNILIDEVRNILSKSKAKKIYVCNAMEQPGETVDYKVLTW